MIVVGLTGSFAAGKSEASKIFKKLGAKIFDADKAAKDAVKKGTATHRAIRQIFGPGYFKKNGELDRPKLAARVFSNPEDLKKLNILIHPGVIFASLQMISKFRSKEGFLVLDVPLLFESRMGKLADFTVVIGAKPSVTMARAKKRGLSPALVKKILSTQWSFGKKAAKADFVITNNGSLKELEVKVREVAEKIKRQASAREGRSII